MSGLLHNEIEKIILQWRFVVVLSLYSLLAAGIGFGLNKDTTNHYTVVSTVCEWVTGGFAGVLIPLSISILVGDSVAGEYSSGTMKLLLIRPVSRRDVWLSKYLAAVCISWMTVLYLGLSISLCLACSMGWGSWTSHPRAEFHSNYRTVWELTWRAYALEGLAVVALTSFVLFVSTVSRSGVAAVGICLGAVLTGIMVTNNAENATWFGFLLFPHLQVADHLIKIFPITGYSLLESILILCFWTAFCVIGGIWLFIRRDVTE